MLPTSSSATLSRVIQRTSARVDCDEAAGVVILDLDHEGRLIGIEVLGATAGLPPEPARTGHAAVAHHARLPSAK